MSVVLNNSYLYNFNCYNSKKLRFISDRCARFADRENSINWAVLISA